MEKKKYNFKEAKYAQIGEIYSKMNKLFREAANGLNEANLSLYEAQFKAVMEEAEQAMKADKYGPFEASNTARWGRMKKSIQPTTINHQTSPSEPMQTEDRPITLLQTNTAQNGLKKPLNEETKEIEKLKQIIRNQQVIIKQQQEIINQFIG